MDTDGKYIKMCDCPEIQGESVTPPYPTDYYAQRKRGATRYGYQLVTADIIDDDYIWLPRQDQIQEMIDGSWVICYEDFNAWYFSRCYPRKTYPNDIFMSMEQMWLAFYMFKRHQKIWDGNKWAKK